MSTLKRLEISGFKSFVDPVTVDFADGVTAIVGPNGCGKSNIADAISWVLGEQSAKSLRSETMQDVIFAGSERRRPLGLAEVRLTLGGLAEALGNVDGADTTISRRVFRTGESEYRLNGKRVTLKQIRDLLMDTGLGIRAYSVIEQGKVETILAGKPQERRRLLEEAAGITRYKARKRIAELKLEESVANLQRLEDVQLEADRSLRSLKRQATAARRFKELQSEHLELLERFLAGRAAHLRTTLADRDRELEAATREETRALAAVSGGEAALAEAREEAERLAAQLAELREHESRLLATIEGRQETIRGGEQTLRELAERLAAGQRSAADRTGELADLERQHGELSERLEQQQRTVAEAETAARSAEQSLAAAASASQQAEQAVRAAEQHAATAAKRLEQVRSDRERQRVEAERTSSRQRHLFEELDGFGREIAEAEAGRAQSAERLAALAAQSTALDQRIAAADGDLRAVLATESKVGEDKSRLEQERAEARHRRAALDELARAHDEGRKTLAKALAELGIDPARTLADRVDPPADWERAFDHHLGELADAVEIPAERDPIELARALAANRTSAILHAAADSPTRPPHPAAREAGVLGSLGEHVAGAALAPAFLVDDPDRARELALQHSDASFLTRDGLVFSGSLVRVQGERARPGVLARRRENARLAALIEQLDGRLTELAGQLTATVGERTASAQKVNQLRNEQSELKREIAVAEARREDATQRVRRLHAARERIESEQQGVAELLAASEVRARELEEALREVEAERSAADQALALARTELEAARGTREAQRAEAASRKAALDLERERSRGLLADRDRLARSADSARGFVATWDGEHDRLESRRKQLEDEVALAREALASALDDQGGAQGSVIAAIRAVDERRDGIRELESRLAAARSLLDDARGRLGQLRVGRAELDQDLRHVLESSREQLGRVPERPPEVPTEHQLAQLGAQVAQAKKRLDELGPVNVLAADEYAEQEARAKELAEQRQDVTRSVESLRKTIREINATSIVRFRETLVEVNRHLATTFSTLFRGGEAEIRLLDEEDPLESGIEIVARPPGKRLQNLMLMSGGEKALTAIALLMALFRTKPSPFCLLDEVDAPLDDVNTSRFLEIIRAMSVDTQFLVVTHNKLTMESASRLYGVTMAERGVSKVVAVDLEEVQPPDVAAASA